MEFQNQFMEKNSLRKIINWFDSYAEADQQSAEANTSLEQLNWLRIIPFIVLHLACGAILWVGWSSIAVIVAIAFYAIRMIAITAFYHRYFAHKTFKTNRIAQFIFAVIGSAATQRGPLWWASHHRHHHYYSDTDDDVHSPKKGLFWSHMGWFLSNKHFKTRLDLIPDFARYRELVLLDRFDVLIPIICMLLLYGLGSLLAALAPELGTNGLQMLVWGYVISTVVLLHMTLCINSMAHRLGTRRFNTEDTSRNNFLLAIFTFGEGWHNNHHRFPNSARQGLKWWEIDISYYCIKSLEKLGVVWNVKTGPTSLQIEKALKEPAH